MGPRVLVVGGHIAENNFVRQVRNTGCEVIWHNGNAGKSFPRFCDALVCAKFQLSHDGFWAAKAAYKGKPTFIADHSWSTIKERFQTFVDNWALTNANGPKQTIMETAMQKEINRISGIAEAMTNTNWRPREVAIPKMKLQYPPELKAKILTVVAEDHRNRTHPMDTVKRLESMGLRRMDGQTFRCTDIYNWRDTVKQKEAKAVKAAAPAKAQPQPATSSNNTHDKLVYELILSANLPPVETTALMRKCMDGKLSQNEALKFIELYTDLRGG